MVHGESGTGARSGTGGSAEGKRFGQAIASKGRVGARSSSAQVARHLPETSPLTKINSALRQRSVGRLQAPGRPALSFNSFANCSSFDCRKSKIGRAHV